nr:MAG TPA: hypothetical protein [Caudoviricetes sp.]
MNNNNDTISMNDLNNDDVQVFDFTNTGNNIEHHTIDLTAHTSNPAPVEKLQQETVQLNQPLKRKAAPSRKSVEDIQIMSADDLDAMMPTKKEEGPKGGMDAMRDKAFSALDDMVKRKQKEYTDFIEKAVEDDKLNKERIKDGLDDAPTSELKYQIQDLPKDITNDPNSKAEESSNDNDDSDIENELEIADIESDDVYDKPASSKAKIVLDEDILELDDDDNDEDMTAEEKNAEEFSSSPEEDFDDILEEDEQKEKEEKQKAAETIVTEDDSSDISKSLTVSAKIDIPDDDKRDAKDVSITGSDFDIDENDIEDDVNAEPSAAEPEEKLTDEQIEAISKKAFKELRSEIIKKVINTSRKLDLKTLSISNKVTDVKSALRAIKSTTDTTVRTASYPMMYANRNFIASSLKGPDIAMLVEADDARIENNPNILLTREQAKILYDHDANPYKPATIESWAKTIPYGDIESIFAAVYLASLKNANYIPRQCPNERCQHSFLTDTIDIDSIIRFPDDDVKAKFNEIRKSELTKEASETYESSVSVINDKFAIGLKAPSIFTILYEYTALNNDFANKYSTMLYIMQYIDYLYYIDEETGELSRIGWKSYVGDYGKTFKSKIATYSKILKEFDETDFTFILALVRSMESKNADSNIRYFIPKTRCKKCGTTIEEEEVSPRQLVFTRQRLVALATTPVEK